MRPLIATLAFFALAPLGFSHGGSYGGGGYGPPADRSLEDIERDLRQGMISADGAERDYGVSVDGDGTVKRMKP